MCILAAIGNDNLCNIKVIVKGFSNWLVGEQNTPWSNYIYTPEVPQYTSDNEEERDEITDKILELFYQVQSDHYRFCNNYLNGNCQFLDRSCEATNPNSMRGIKNQCPKPEEYHYQNIFQTYDIIRATFDVAPPYILDDLTTTPPVRRSIINVSFGYYDYYRIGGAVSEHIIIDEELL